MFGLLRRGSVLSDEDTQFQIATYQWLLKHFGGKDFYADTKLILPTSEYFPAQVANEDQVAIQTFLAVKNYAGMTGWPCRLERQEDDINPILAHGIQVEK